MPRMRITLEEVLEIDKAIEMVEKDDSTDPYDVAMVDDYKEHLKELQENAQNDAQGDSFDSGSEATSDESTSAEEPLEASGDTPAEDTPAKDTEADKETDKDKEEDKDPADEEQQKKSDEAEAKIKETDKAMEHLVYALECYEQLQTMKKNGSYKQALEVKKVGFALEFFQETAQELNIELPLFIDMQALSTGSYVQGVKQVDLAIEGVKEYILLAYEKVIAMIKWIINWLKDYFFYDPVKDQKIDAVWRARREKIKELQKKSLSFQNYQRDMSLAIGKKQYRERANFIVIGSKDVSCQQAVQGINMSMKFLSQYWNNTATFVKSNVLMKMKDVFEFDKNGNYADKDSGFLNISYASYNPVILREEKDYRSVSQKALPKNFKIYVSQSVLCGDKRLTLTMPDKAYPETINLITNTDGYGGFMLGDENMQGIRKAIFYTHETTILLGFTEEVQRAYADKRKLSVFIQDVIRHLESMTNKMISNLDQMVDKDMPAAIRSAHIRRLRFNINVINNLFNKPLVSSVFFFDRLFSAIDHFADKNMRMIEDVVDDMETKKKEMGLNV